MSEIWAVDRIQLLFPMILCMLVLPTVYTQKLLFTELGTKY